MLGWTTWTSVLMKLLWICFWNSGKFDGYGFLLLTPSSYVFPQAFYHMPSSKALMLHSDCRQKCFNFIFMTVGTAHGIWYFLFRFVPLPYVVLNQIQIQSFAMQPQSEQLYQNSTLDIHHNSVVMGVTAKILQTGSSLVGDSCEGSQRMDSKVLELTSIMVTALYKQTSWSSSSLSPAHRFTSFCGPSPYKQMCNLSSKSESST